MEKNKKEIKKIKEEVDLPEKTKEKTLYRFKKGRPPEGYEKHKDRTFEVGQTKLGLMARYLFNGKEMLFVVKERDIEIIS